MLFHEAQHRSVLLSDSGVLRREVGVYARRPLGAAAPVLPARTMSAFDRIARDPLLPPAGARALDNARQNLRALEQLVVRAASGAIAPDEASRLIAERLARFNDAMTEVRSAVIDDAVAFNSQRLEEMKLRLVVGVAVAAILLVGLLVMAVATIRSVSAPLKRLEQYVRRLGREPVDFTQMAEDGPRELRVVAESLDSFAADIRMEVATVQILVTQQRSATQYALARVEEQTRHVAQAEVNASQVAAGAMGELMELMRGLAIFEGLDAACDGAGSSRRILGDIIESLDDVALGYGSRRDPRAVDQLVRLSAELAAEAVRLGDTEIQLRDTVGECRTFVTRILDGDERIAAELEGLLALISESHDGLLAAQSQAESLAVTTRRVESALRRIPV